MSAGLLAAVGGCGRRSAPPVVESGQTVTLSPGRIFRFTDHFHGRAAPTGLPRRMDGQAQVLLSDVLQPVLCVRVPHVLRQKLALPSGATLRLAFGLTSGGAATRFTVRMRHSGKSTQLLSNEVTRWGGGQAANWTPRSFDLPAGDVELELAVELVGKPARSQEGTTACALWVNPLVLVPSAAARPNLVLVHLDALRPDHLGCYGYARDTSPNLDRLAAHGVLFEDANATATWTYPSVQGYLTSNHQSLSFGREVGDALSATGAGAVVRGPALTGASLQGQLRAAGYETLACTGGGYLDPRFGFDVGFDWYWSTNYALLPDQLAAVKDRLPRTHGQPFFLFLQTYEVHHYRKGFGHGLSHYSHGYAGKLTNKDLIEEAVSGRLRDLTPADRQYLRDLYDGEVRHADELLGAFLDWLFAQPWGKNTVVAVIADHGEAFGEHGQMGHCGVPYRELAHVPLIFFRSDHEWPGRRVKQPVSLIDLTPTLLDLASAPPAKGMVGRSLAPRLEGRPLPDRPMLCGNTASLMAREGRWWYLTWRNTQPEELYDILRDPNQQHNLAASAPDELAHMRGVLAQLAAQSARGYHLAVTMPPAGDMMIAVESTAGYDVPTLGTGDTTTVHRVGKGGQRLEVHFAPGRAQHLVLFDPAPGGTATVSARANDIPVEAGRFHLGKNGASPQAVPIILQSEIQASLISERPASKGQDWGLWLWLPPAAVQSRQPEALRSGKLPADLERQLKALGYLK